MKSDIVDLAEGKKRLSVEISDEEFQEQIDGLLADLAKDAELPGFRKGKVPPEHLKARLGQEKVHSDAMGRSINKFLIEAIEKSDLDVIAISDLAPDEANLSFSAILEVRPEPKLSGYEELEIKLPPLQLTDEETEEIEKNYLKSFGELVDVSRPGIKGDHLSIDLRCTYNGAEVEGLNISDFVYELGSGSALKEMDKELEGSKVGDILEFNAQHPSESGNMRAKVLVKKIQQNKIPDLTDELAAEISEFETAEAFREDMRSQIAESKRHNLWHLLQERVINELAGLVKDPLPESLIEAEVDAIKRRIAENPNIPDLNEAAFEGAEIQAQMREQAVNSIKVDLAFRSLIRQEDIKVEDSELEEAVKQIEEQIAAAKDNSPSPQADDLSDLKPNVEALRISLLRQNALLWLIERSNVKDDNNLEIDTEDLKPKELKQEKEREKETSAK